MIPKYEKGLSQYEHIIHELYVLLDVFDYLSKGLVLHSIIRPGILQEFQFQVELDLQVHYPE